MAIFDKTQAKLIARRCLSEACYRTGAIRLLQRYSHQPWRILTYHRVVDPESAPLPVQPGMYVRPETFDRHMEYLATQCHVISLEELLQAMVNQTTIPEGTVVITFDDGWRDTYTNAFPILRDFSLPATVFLATAYVGSHDLFWTDRVAHSIRTLRLEATYRDRVLSLVQSSEKIAAEFREAIAQLIGRSNEQQREERTERLIEALKHATPNVRRGVVDTLFELTKEFSTARLERMFVTWDEVAEMAAERVSFGSHSHNHFRMTELNSAQLRDELVNSYQHLHEHRIRPVAAFCYPGGYMNEATQAALRDRDIRYAMIVRQACDFQANPMLLGRINIHEDVTNSAATFAFRVWGSSTK